MQLSALGTSAAALLQEFHDQLIATNPNFDMPGHMYVGAGDIPWDSEGLYVYLGQLHTGQPGQPQSTNIVSVAATVFAVSFYVQIVREVATQGYYQQADGPNPASDDQLTNDGMRAVNDAGALAAAAAQIKKSTTLVTNTQAGFVIGQLMPVGPSGGMAAMRLQLDLSIDEA